MPSTELEGVMDRHMQGKMILDQFAKYAPAFGMIGTLLGLIFMLGSMSDPSAIGPSMAVALITTRYGAIVANVNVHGEDSRLIHFITIQALFYNCTHNILHS